MGLIDETNWSISVKLLREYIRELLVESSAKKPGDVPGDWKIWVDKSGNNITVEMLDKDENQIARITAHKQSFVGPCSNAHFVGMSESQHGWGPMIYDVMMELVTAQGSALMSNRETVSDEAYRVWLYYLKNRDDVEEIQLDDLKNSLTGDDSDNCEQKAFDYKLYDDFPSMFNMSKDRKIDFKKNMMTTSPLTKAYKKKDNSTIDALEKKGALVYR